MATPTKRHKENMEHWMTNLPQKLKSLPLIYLAIPGSHDSATCAITSKSNVSPDAETLIQRLKFLGPLLGFIMSKWSRTQSYNITKQLIAGIRYFDLRVATKQGTDDLFLVHGLYAEEIRGVLEDVASFLDQHPGEIVLLDCQHFYAFQQTDHEHLMRLLTTTFGNKMLPYIPHMKHISLEYMTIQFKYQVIVIYRSDAARFGQPLLWPSACFPTPWPNTVSVQRLFATLDDGIRTRNNNAGYISQCVLTPTTWFVCRNLLSSLKSKLVVPLEKSKYEWLYRQNPGHVGRLNIVISDYIDLQDGQFAKEVVGLNWKLLGNSVHQSSGNSNALNSAGAAITPVE